MQKIEVVSGGKDRGNLLEDTYQREKNRLLSFIIQRTPTREDAEDVLQDVFYELTESYQLAKPIEKVVSWLYRVARNRITDWYRKKRPERLDDGAIHTEEETEEPLSLADILPDPELLSDDRMMWDAVYDQIAEAIEELPDAQREVFEWHEIEGKSLKEIAELTDTPIKTVISRKRYAILYLRSVLQDLYREALDE